MRRGVIVFAVFAAACGGGTSASSPQAARPTASTQAPSAPPSAAASPAARAFGDLAGAAANTPYKVTYNISTGAGAGGTQTWYVSGKNFRIDIAVEPGGAAALSVYTIPEGSFTCINMGSGMQCTKVGEAEATAQSPAAGLGAQLRANPGSFSGTFKESRTIAGAATACYAITGASPGTICYTSAGVPLFYQFNVSGSSFTMEATAFGVPSEADFKLPAQ